MVFKNLIKILFKYIFRKKTGLKLFTTFAILLKTLGLKLLFATLLSLMLLLPSLGSLVIYTQFKIAQDKIAKTICVQRANSNNSCKGHCQLQKSLKKFEDNEKRMENTHLKEKTDLVYTTNSFNFTILPLSPLQNNSVDVKHICKNPKRISLGVFHPPLV